MNKVYIVSTGMDILGTDRRRWFEVENILSVFSDEEDAIRCFKAAAGGVGVDHNWPIGKKAYIYPKAYAVMRVYEVKEPRSYVEISGQVLDKEPVQEGKDAG